jgi:phosphotransferase system enzyme I (PtsI)
MSFQVFGAAVSRGIAIGRAVLVSSSRMDVAHYFVPDQQIPGEIARLRSARDRVAQSLEALQRDLPLDAPTELSALLDVHLMLLRDETLAEATKTWILERKYNAEWALSAQYEVLARQFDDMEDEYLRERKADLEQVVERMLKALAQGGTGAAVDARVLARAGSDDKLVLVAGDISPADMLQLRSSVFEGLITDVGGRTSHTAILARSMDIPAVVGAREASRIIRQDDWVVIDGDAGVIVVNPSPIVFEEYRFRQRQSELERARLDRLRHTPALTLDGESVELLANIELPGDVDAALAAGAVGVGLFRTEFLFMNRQGRLPDEEEQYEAYRSAVIGMRGMPVTIRTVDIGADKPLDHDGFALHGRHELALNPALGLRAIRWSLAEPDMFQQQLRAILRAAVHGKVRMLVPMVAHRAETLAVLRAVDQARAALDGVGMAHGPLQIGAMIEVPAAALSIDVFLRHFDFVSIGTNDLIQYTLAIDRSDQSVAHLYDPWHPAVLRLIATTIARARAQSKPVSVCGEMAGDPVFTDLLLGMGLRSFSMQPSQLSTVKQRLLRSDTRRLAPAVESALTTDDAAAAMRSLPTTASAA